jgi:hypothetical protein
MIKSEKEGLNMKTKIALIMALFFMTMTCSNVQGVETKALDLPGDSLDLYATLNLFQKSKTIEEFEAALNDEKTGINNLDLNLDSQVDFIKVVTKQEGDNFSFVLQVDVLDDETQDIGVILVTKSKDKKVSIQMVGDKELYGKDYIIEPKDKVPAITANPAYTGPEAVESQVATVVSIESTPVVQYVYSPMYSPYYPPYYYGYYPVYYAPYPVVSINIYFGRNHHHHNHYHGGHRGGNTVIIRNNNTYNSYNKGRSTSTTVNRNKKAGDYTRNNTAKLPSSNARNVNNISNSNTNANANNNVKKSTVPVEMKPSQVRSPVPANKPNMRAQPKRQNMPKRNPKGN